MVASSVGGAFSIERDLPECHGRQPGRTTSPARPATAPAAACPPGPSRPASPPASRTASGSGCAARARAGENGGPHGDLFVTVKSRRTGSSAARATTSPSTCRSPSTRPRSAPRSRCPTLDGAAGDPQDPRRHPERPHVPGPRPRRAARRDGTQGRPAGDRRGPGARAARPTRPARPSTPTARRPPATTLRANLFEPEACVMSGEASPAPARPRTPPVYVISVAAELTGPAPADAARLRADGPGHRPAAPAAAVAATR